MYIFRNQRYKLHINGIAMIFVFRTFWCKIQTSVLTLFWKLKYIITAGFVGKHLFVVVFFFRLIEVHSHIRLHPYGMKPSVIKFAFFTDAVF